MTGIATRLLGGSVSPLVDQHGRGRPILLLHGGAGPASMAPLVPFLRDQRVVLPTHPGFDGTERPDWLESIPDLASCYLALIDVLQLDDVLVVGNSAGGWIAAEMATRRPASISGLVLVNAVGLKPTSATGDIVNPMSLKAVELAAFVFADPAKLTPLSPAAAERSRANQQVLNVYAGDPFMHDPSLGPRLGSINVPSLVLWGECDRIVTPAYGEMYADAIPGALFQSVANAGHLPQIEHPEAVAAAIVNFCAEARS